MSIFKIDHATRKRTAERFEKDVDFRRDGVRPLFCNLVRKVTTNVDSPPARTRMLPRDVARSRAFVVGVAAVPPHTNDTYHAFVPKGKAPDVRYSAIGGWYHAV